KQNGRWNRSKQMGIYKQKFISSALYDNQSIMKNYLLSLTAFLLFSVVSAQIVVPIEDQNTLELNPCDTAIITASAYSGATIQSIDISLDENSAYTAIINPAFFGQLWDIDATSELRFYDGFEESALL